MIKSVFSWASKFGWRCSLILCVTRSRLSLPPTTCWRLSHWGLAVGSVQLHQSHHANAPAYHSLTHPLRTSEGLSRYWGTQSNPADIRTGYPRNTSLHCNHFIICLAQPVILVKNCGIFPRTNDCYSELLKCFEHTEESPTYSDVNLNICKLNAHFDVLLAVNLSIILVIKQLNAHIILFISLLYASTCFVHYVLIIRMSKLYYAAFGIIKLCRWPSRAQVERGLSQPVHRLRGLKLCTGRPPAGVMIPDAV